MGEPARRQTACFVVSATRLLLSSPAYPAIVGSALPPSWKNAPGSPDRLSLLSSARCRRYLIASCFRQIAACSGVTTCFSSPLRGWKELPGRCEYECLTEKTNGAAAGSPQSESTGFSVSQVTTGWLSHDDNEILLLGTAWPDFAACTIRSKRTTKAPHIRPLAAVGPPFMVHSEAQFVSLRR